jgi:hypothetical protein
MSTLERFDIALDLSVNSDKLPVQVSGQGAVLSDGGISPGLDVPVHNTACQFYISAFNVSCDLARYLDISISKDIADNAALDRDMPLLLTVAVYRRRRGKSLLPRKRAGSSQRPLSLSFLPSSQKQHFHRFHTDAALRLDRGISFLDFFPDGCFGAVPLYFPQSFPSSFSCFQRPFS